MTARSGRGYAHHTDGEQEYAYDRTAATDRLDKGLAEAAAKGWTVVDMKRDWKRVFPLRSRCNRPLIRVPGAVLWE